MWCCRFRKTVPVEICLSLQIKKPNTEVSKIKIWNHNKSITVSSLLQNSLVDPEEGFRGFKGFAPTPPPSCPDIQNVCLNFTMNNVQKIFVN